MSEYMTNKRVQLEFSEYAWIPFYSVDFSEFTLGSRIRSQQTEYDYSIYINQELLYGILFSTLHTEKISII